MTLLEKVQALALFVAVILFLWAAAVVAGWTGYGDAAFLELVGLAAAVFGLAPWPRVVATRRRP